MLVFCILNDFLGTNNSDNVTLSIVSIDTRFFLILTTLTLYHPYGLSLLTLFQLSTISSTLKSKSSP